MQGEVNTIWQLGARHPADPSPVSPGLLWLWQKAAVVLLKPLVEKRGTVWVAPSPRAQEGPSRLRHQQETKVQPRRTLLAQQSVTESLVPGGTRSGVSEQPQTSAGVVVGKPSSSLLQTRLRAPLLARSIITVPRRGCHFLSFLPPLPGPAAGLAPTGAFPGGHRPRGAGGGLRGRGRCCRTGGGLIPLQDAGGEQLQQVGGERRPVQVLGALRGVGHGRGAAARLQNCPHGGGEGTQGTGHGLHAPGQGCQVLVGPAVSPQQAGGDPQELGDLLRV